MNEQDKVGKLKNQIKKQPSSPVLKNHSYSLTINSDNKQIYRTAKTCSSNLNSVKYNSTQQSPDKSLLESQ